MTFGMPDNATTNSVRIPSIVILGADALLAALPASPIQLAHACGLAGYQHVVPASWGDELIAAASLRALRDRAQVPAIQCSCPYVAHRLLAVGTDLRPFLVSLVAPPVVLARYLRTAYAPRKLRITYVGRCPGATDESIDARLTPEELLAIFADRQIGIEDQPEVFDSVIPPDRRRYRSQPGGLPTPEMLWSANEGSAGGARTLVELYGDELSVELAQHLLAGKPVLIDVAPKLGCVCSGASAGVNPIEARARVTMLEPPRASGPVVDESLVPEAKLPLPASPRSAIDVVSSPTSVTGYHGVDVTRPNDSTRDDGTTGSTGHRSEWPEPRPPAVVPLAPSAARRHSPARGIARPVSANLPTARDADGRQLPRSYVARRRSPARVPRPVPVEVEAPIPAVIEGATADGNTISITPDEPRQASGADTVLVRRSRGESVHDSSGSVAATTPFAPSLIKSPGESVGRLRSMHLPATRAPDVSPEGAARFSERAVALPVTPRSDGRPREEASSSAAGERPVMQLLTLGLLIAMIVLISAAVGVLVGRWMSQR